MQDQPALSPQAQALLDACNVVVRKMQEEGTYDQPHRAREYVESLLEHTTSRYPHIMDDEEKTKAMADEMVELIMLHFALKSDN